MGRDVKWVRERAQLEFTKEAKATSGIGTVQDITERKRAEEERRRSAERFRAIADYTYDWENWIGVDGKLLWVNPAVERITGYSVDECMAMPDFPVPIVAEADRQAIALQMREAVEGSSGNDFEFRVRRKDGRLAWVAASWQPIHDSQGARLGYRSSMRDIAARKRAEETLQQSEAYLAEAQRLSHTGSFAFDVASNKYVYISEECLRIFELDAQQTLPSREAVSRLIHREDWERVQGDFDRLLREKVDISSEFRIVLPSGAIKHIQVMRHPVLNEAGEVATTVGTAMDITERKRAEEEVRNTAAQWQATFDAVQDLILLLDKDFRILRANHAVTRFLGLPFDKIVGGHCYDLIHGASTSPAECPLAKMRQSRKHEEAEVLARKGGPWLSVSVDPLLDASGELIQVVHVARDITERKRAEEALSRSESYLAEAQRLSHTGSWAWDVASGNYVYSSEEYIRISGFDPQQGLTAKDQPLQQIHPDDVDKFWQAFQKLIDEKVDSEDEYRIVLPDGTVKYVHAICHPVLNADGELVEIVGTTIDITERKRAEEELRDSETRFRTFVDHAGDALFVQDLDQGTIVDVNRAACDSLGYSRQELIGKTPLGFHLDSDRVEIEAVRERASAGETVSDTHWHRRKDGSTFPVEAQTTLVSYDGHRFLLKVARDITDRLQAEEQREKLRQLEAELAHLDRLTMLGELTASIAHEVNQPLSGVMSNASAGLRWLAGEAPTWRKCGKVSVVSSVTASEPAK